MSEFANTSVTQISTGGGAVRASIVSNTAQGNAGAALPCRECMVIVGPGTVAVTAPVMMNIGAAATSILGILIPAPPHGTLDDTVNISVPIPAALPIAIDDVSKLHFYCSSANSVVIDILYRR